MFAMPFAIMFALASVSSVPVPPAAGGDRAAPAIAHLLQSPALAGLDVGAAVRCTRDDALWGTSNADELLNPASGTKLLTTAAASRAFPLDLRWPTTVHGKLVSERVDGDLVLVGNGDPWLQLADLDRLATATHKAGVRTIDGDLVVDVSRFPDSLLPPAYDQKNTDSYYRPAVAALGLAFGTVMIGVRPGKKVGDAVRVTPSPNVDAIDVQLDAKTVEGKGTSDLVIESRAGKDGKTRIIVSGTLGVKAPNQAVKKRVEDPALVAADVFRVYLQKRGIRLAGKVRLSHQPVPHGPELARIESRSVAEIIHEINTFSNNYMAESIFAHLGEDSAQHAEWSRGKAAVEHALAAMSLRPGSYRIVNGSGLYDATHVSARGMVALLDAMAEGGSPEWRAAYRDSLAIAGKTGTLRGRMKALAGQVHAKTGTLDDAISLSGYVTAKSGCELAFSLLVNGPIGAKAPRVQGALDELVMAISEL